MVYGTPPDVDIPSLALQAGTPVAGFALQNGTPNVISWTAPNDGALHRVLIGLNAHTTVLATGGQLNVNFTMPDGFATTKTMLAGGQAVGFNNALVEFYIQPGSTVTLVQQSALTAGAETIWAEIWGL